MYFQFAGLAPQNGSIQPCLRQCGGEGWCNKMCDIFSSDLKVCYVANNCRQTIN